MENLLSTVLLPLSLAAVMFGMGLNLTKQDFKSVFENPRTFLIGSACQLILLPFLAFILSYAFQLGSTATLGLMAVTLVPGAITSNIFTFFAKGNLALSICLTAVMTLLAPFTVPMALDLTVKSLGTNPELIAFPLSHTVFTLLSITVFPIVIGMYTRQAFSDFANNSRNYLRYFSLVALALIIIELFGAHNAIIKLSFSSIGLVCLLLNTAALALAYLLTNSLNLDRKDCITIAIETSFRNTAMSLFIAGALMGPGEAIHAPIIYTIMMFVTGGILIWNLAKEEKLEELEKAHGTDK